MVTGIYQLLIIFAVFVFSLSGYAQETGNDKSETAGKDTAKVSEEQLLEQKASAGRATLLKRLAFSADEVVRKAWKRGSRNREGWRTARNSLKKITDSEQEVIAALASYVELLLKKNYQGLNLTGEEVPDWMVAAFTFQAISSRFGIGGLPGRNDYRSVRLAFHRRIYPEVRKICSNSIPPQENYSYLLYGQHASLVMEIFLADCGKDAIGSWLVLHQKGSSSTEILNQLLAGVLVEGESVQDWYLKRAPKLAMRRFGPMSLDVVKLRLAELKYVSVPEVSGAGKVTLRRIPMHVSLGKFRNHQQRRDVAANQKISVIKLLQETPLALQDAVSAYIGAYNSLIGDDADGFRQKYQQAEKQFEAAAARYEKITRFMDEMEVKFTDWTVYLSPYLEVTSGARADDEDDHKISRYLDKVEELLQ